jgi:hypothetical protein
MNQYRILTVSGTRYWYQVPVSCLYQVPAPIDVKVLKSTVGSYVLFITSHRTVGRAGNRYLVPGTSTVPVDLLKPSRSFRRHSIVTVESRMLES